MKSRLIMTSSQLAVGVFQNNAKNVKQLLQGKA